MQTDWLIDFMTLAETRSFSRAAQLRQVTQPAFSRRIRSLEAWAMTTLVDRSRHPPVLTPAGQLLQARAPELVAAMQHTHALLQGHTSIHPTELRFAAPHALALHFFPDWILGLEATLDGLDPQLTMLGSAEAMKQLSHGGCDLLLAYRETGSTKAFDPKRFQVLRLGSERLLPCTHPDARRAAPRRLPVTSDAQGVFDPDICESLMAMTLAGQGMAFLPERSVQPELARKRLVVAGPPLSNVLDICLVRLRSIGAETARRTPADTFWRRLQIRAGTHAKGTMALAPPHRNTMAESA